MAFRGGIQELMKQANRMQARMEKMREELKDREFTGQAADGRVKAHVNGNRELLRIEFAKDELAQDVELLQDMIVAAVNDAMRRADETVEQETDKITGGLKIPGLV